MNTHNEDSMILGLDIGIGSIGWAVINETQARIEDLGVRLFESGEVQEGAKTSRASQMRRAYRSSRRINRRRIQRNERIKKECASVGLLTTEEIKTAFKKQQVPNDVVGLRVKGLDEELTPLELLAVLITMSNHRGYKEFYDMETDEETKEKNAGKLFEAKNKVIQEFEKSKYRTLGEMIFKSDHFKNSRGQIAFRNNKNLNEFLFGRKELIEETRKILETQQQYYSFLAVEEIDKLISMIFSQRDFEVGPGKRGANYKGQVYTGFDATIGNCIFYPEEKRYTKNSLVYDLYVFINELSQIQIVNKTTGEIITLNLSQLLACYQIILDSKGTVEIGELNKLLEKDGVSLEAGRKKKLSKLPYASFLMNDKYFTSSEIEEFKQEVKNYSDENSKANRIGHIVTMDITPERRRKSLAGLVSNEKIMAVSCATLPGTANCSKKYMLEAIDAYTQGSPYGVFQAEFLENNDGFTHEKVTNGKKLSPIMNEELSKNPVVYRSVNESRKVLNALLNNYHFSQINVEVARDMSRSIEERAKIQKAQLENQKARNESEQALRDELEKRGRGDTVTKKLMDRYTLWKMQDEQDLYTHKKISFEDLLVENKLQIDHILPQSVVLDDTLNNKVLTFTGANAIKGDRVPRQALKDMGNVTDEEYMNKINVLARKGLLSKKKIAYLTLEALDPDTIQGFVSRNLNDTRYICRYVVNLFKTAMDELGQSTKVNAINGSVTTQFRRKWLTIKTASGNVYSNFSLDDKGRELHDYHHAVDAVILANLKPSSIALAMWSERLKQIQRDKHLPEKEAIYNREYQKMVSSLGKYRGLSESYIKSCLHRDNVPSICKDLYHELDVRIPLDFEYKEGKTIYSYLSDERIYRKLRFKLLECQTQLKGKEPKLLTEEQIVEIKTLISDMSIPFDMTSIPEASKVDAKTIKDLLKETEPSLQNQYIEDITLRDEKEYHEKCKVFYGETLKPEFPYISYKVSRKYKGSVLASDNPVSFEEVKKQLPGIQTKEDLVKYLDYVHFPSDDLEETIKRMKCEYYIKNIDNAHKNNFTIYSTNNYYCLEIYKDPKGKYGFRGIRYSDIKHKDKELFLLNPLPEGFEHCNYVFKNEYVFYKKKTLLIRGSHSVTVNSIVYRTIRKKQKFFTAAAITKPAIDVLGKLRGTICGEPFSLKTL